MFKYSETVQKMATLYQKAFYYSRKTVFYEVFLFLFVDTQSFMYVNLLKTLAPKPSLNCNS